MDWLTLCLICAFCLASSDAAVKHGLRQAEAVELLVVRLGLSGLLLSPLLLRFEMPDLPAEFWCWLALLVPLEIIAMLIYVKTIRDYPLSLTLPYLAFTPVLVLITGWAVLGETVSLSGLAGIGLVVVGTWLLNLDTRPRMDWSTMLTPLRAILVNPGSRLMLGAAAIYAVTSVGSKAAMQWMPPMQFGALYFSLIAAVVLVLALALRPSALRIHRFGVARVSLVAIPMAAMVVTHFVALSMVEAAYMIAVKRTSLLFGMLYGALLFGESQLPRHLSAGTIMVAGVMLIAL